MDKGNIDGTLEALVKSFFMGKLDIIETEEVNNITWNIQEEFLKRTINSTLYKKYPCNQKFCGLFFKKLIETLEPEQEVHDDIYNFLCSMMKADTENAFSFRYYLINNSLSDVIIIKETRNILLNGTTGLRTWEAALILSDWALCNKDIFTDRTVLELGSGVGFTGITIAKHCPLKSIIMTDYHEDVLDVITNNVQINFPEFKHKHFEFMLKEGEKDKTIDVMRLDWNHIDKIPKQLLPDIIIAADIVYDPSILRSLIKVFQVFDSDIYIASVIRNEDTFNEFLNILGASNFMYKVIPFTKKVHIEWDQNIKHCLLSIKKCNGK